VTFAAIETQGVDAFLEQIAHELVRRRYVPLPPPSGKYERIRARSVSCRFLQSGIGWCKVRSSGSKEDSETVTVFFEDMKRARPIRATNLLERLFVEERRRLKIIPAQIGSQRGVLGESVSMSKVMDLRSAGSTRANTLPA
jgi:hypothetical protein